MDIAPNAQGEIGTLWIEEAETASLASTARFRAMGEELTLLVRDKQNPRPGVRSDHARSDFEPICNSREATRSSSILPELLGMPSTQTLYNDTTLKLDRCPHCRVALPLLATVHGFQTADSGGGNKRNWRVYSCSTCGGAVLGAARPSQGQNIQEIYPTPETLEEGLPSRAAAFLHQAMESINAPSGAVMLCASSVDAMLKEKGLKTGSLYARIESAAADGLITKEMSLWAHDVRLDANDERHADEADGLPTNEDAMRCINFTKALGLFMYSLPMMVQRGRENAARGSAEPTASAEPE